MVARVEVGPMAPLPLLANGVGAGGPGQAPLQVVLFEDTESSEHASVSDISLSSLRV